MAISDAVSTAAKSRIVGYKLTKGDFRTNSPNLPQRVCLYGEANTANQADLDTDPYQITTAQQAGARYGYGSPLHIAARILLPKGGGGLSGIPLIVFPQAEAVGATSKILEITPTGVATSNGTHTLVIAGRENIDAVFYNISILKDDTTADITAKISDAVNNVLSCPMTATDDDYSAQLESKWKGATANKLSVTVNTNDDDLGITYAIAEIQAAAGTPSISASLAKMGTAWNTIVCNTYEDTQILTAFELYNGVADPVNPTGQFVGIIMRPLVAVFGNTDDNPSAITDARLNEMTNAIAPAPLSAGLPMEAAANMALLHAVISQDNPHLDVAGQSYPDMPTPSVIGSMSDYTTRDSYVKKGCSTVDLVGGKYVIQDFVTTYHKLGEEPPQFAYPRNLMIDNNVRYTYYLQEQINVADHAIADDDTIVRVGKVIKPKQWKQILSGKSFTEDLGARCLIVDLPFTKESITTGLSTSNPDRLETAFRYKRSGYARILSTTAEAGFNFGTLQ